MHFQPLLLIFSIVIQFSNNVNGDMIPMTLKNWYATLTTQEEKDKFMPASYTVARRGIPCVNQFIDQTEDGTNTYYCYNILSLPRLQNRQRKLATTKQTTSLIACSTSQECHSSIGINSNCDQTMGIDFIASDGTPKNGICIVVEPFAYTFMEFIKNMDRQKLQATKSSFLPALYDETLQVPFVDCRTQGNGCQNGAFCSMVDIFPESQIGPNAKHYCYKLPRIIDAIFGQKLATLSPNGDLALCETNTECPSTHNQVQKCEIDAGGRKYVRQNGTTRQIVDGVCAKTAPISNRMYREYSMLDDNVTYAERIKYFPVDFQGLASPLTNCISHDTCAVDEFCDLIYDYSTGSAHTELKYCFKGPRDVPTSAEFSYVVMIVIPIIVCIVLIALIAVFVVFKKKIFGGSKSKPSKNKKHKKKKTARSSSDSFQSPKTSITEQQRQWNGVSTMIR